MKENSNFDAFYPFIIIIIVFIANLIRNRANEKKEKEQNRGRKPSPHKTFSAPLKPPPTMLKTAQKKQEMSIVVPSKEIRNTKKRPRIVKLVSGLKSKKELVILSEILFKKYHA